MNFRFFDADGQQLTNEQLNSMRIVTPAMEHVFATVLDRVGKLRNQADNLENNLPKQYH